MGEIEETEYETVSKTVTKYECDIDHCTEIVNDKEDLFTVEITGPNGNLNEEKHVCSKCVIDRKTYEIFGGIESIKKWIRITVNSTLLIAFIALLFISTAFSYFIAGYMASIDVIPWLIGGLMHIFVLLLILTPLSQK